MAHEWKSTWPVLKTYDEDHLLRIALPLGGIGTGTVSLGGRGDLRDWEIVIRPAKGFIPVASTGRGNGPFFAVFAKVPGEEAVARTLEGPLDSVHYEGASGSPVVNHGLPRFRRCTFKAAYPFGQVRLGDPDMPIDARIEAFNPLIPADADRSGIPVVALRFVLRNRVGKAITTSVCGSLPNFIGCDGTSGSRPEKGNSTVFRKGKKVRGLFMTAPGLAPDAEACGTLALTTTGGGSGVTARTSWAALSWGDSLLDFWDDFSSDGALDEREADTPHPMGSLCVRLRIPPREVRTVTFLLTWHFPNRMTWTPTRKQEDDCCCDGDDCGDRIGNYYTTRYADAWDVAERVAADLATLEDDTVSFVKSFCESDLPDEVKEAALFNLSTLRSQTCFRTPDGRFFGWEGCHDRTGCCLGSCTHVWNYEQATAFLFGELAKTMRDVEFGYATGDDGLMSFRVHLPLTRAQNSGKAAADGQMGCIMKVFRDWQLSGDEEMLRRLWPNVKKAVEFCWIPGGWDADRDGVMEGCQHNTMDVEYYGPNPQMAAWYLGALRAAEEMARHVDDAGFADACRGLFESGRAWVDANLFNGEYYEHEIRPPNSADDVAPSLRVGMGAADLSEPVLQLGAGCLVDQLVGQFMAHVCGLGHLLDKRHVRKTLKSIVKHNFRTGFYGHFNHMRSYVLGDESALLMASYPRGRRPARPFPYYNEVMTGFEYSTAVHMLYEDQVDRGLKMIRAVRDRYDGRKRSPFDEAECGHHYARAMASWGAVLALTGFQYSGVRKSLTFAAKEGKWFWSTGYAWGTCAIRKTGAGLRVKLKVKHGTLALKELSLTGAGRVLLEKGTVVEEGSSATWTV